MFTFTIGMSASTAQDLGLIILALVVVLAATTMAVSRRRPGHTQAQAGGAAAPIAPEDTKRLPRLRRQRSGLSRAERAARRRATREENIKRNFGPADGAAPDARDADHHDLTDGTAR
jgi:hypothetical protein